MGETSNDVPFRDVRAFALATDEDSDADLARFEKMPIEEVNATLRKHGIDPEETVKAVIALVHEKLHSRRVDHLQELIFLVMLAVASAIRSQMLSCAAVAIGRAAPVRLLS